MLVPPHSDRRDKCSSVSGGRAFTLIEILVVVAIIATLIAVLLPSLARSRANARASVCMSNLHQFSLAFQMYQSENKDYVPRGGTQVSQLWIMLVTRQLGDKHHYLDAEQVPVEKHPIFSCPDRVRTLPFPFIDYVVNTMPSDLQYLETREIAAPTIASIWRYPGRVLLLGDTAFEDTYGTWQTGATTSADLRQSRENHDRAKQWDPSQPFDANTMGSLSRMDFFRPQDMPSQPSRRPGSITHMKTFTNWVYADNHVARVPFLNNARPCEQWLQMMGILDPKLKCW